MKTRLVLSLALLLLTTLCFAQVNIAPGGSVNQDFTIGTSATATLPSGWKADKNTSVRTLGTYAAAVTATEQRAGNNMSSSAANGIYNYAAGDPTAATERAIGWISSSSATKSGNLYVQLANNGAAQIPSFTISYAVEKYRMGNNTAGFSIQMYYSTDGSNWTSAGTDFLTSFAADASNNGYASAPGVTSNVTNKTLNVALNPSSSLYLAWNYSVTSGTTTSNAQGLGIDDVSIVAAQGQSSNPTIIVTGTPLSNFGGVLSGQYSDSQSYFVSGTDLEADIAVYAPEGFQISLDDSNWDTEIFLSPTSGDVDETEIFVRFAPTAVQSYSGYIEHASSNASQVDVAVSGNGIKGEPSSHVTGFSVAAGTNPEFDINVTWIDATGSIVPDGYLIKGSNVSFNDISDPVDGVPENNALLIRNVTPSTQGFMFTNLNSSTTYYFKVFPYTNSGSSINYKVNETVPSGSHTTATGPTLVEVIVPQYIQGVSGTNNQRLPWACRLTLENMGANKTYRYFGMFVISSDTPTTNGAGIGIFVNPNGTITRSTSLSLTTAGQYSEFTTDANGSYTGWFMGEPSGNSRFAVGNQVFYRLMLNDGNNGTAIALRLTTASSSRVINFGTQENVNQGTFLWGVSQSPSKNFVFVYDNIDGNGRPISGSVIEDDGLNLSAVTQISAAYRNNVDNVAGAWGVIIPNSVETKGFSGILRVESRKFEDGELYVASVDNDGIWAGTSTVNPVGGDTSPIDLSNVVTLPVELSSFSATITAQNFVNLMWVTQTETGVQGFYVFRNTSSELASAHIISPMIPATNTSQQQSYVFTDTELTEDGTYYYWLQNTDFDGNTNYHGPITVIYSTDGGNNGTPGIPSVTELKAIYPNPFNPMAYIPFNLTTTENVEITIYNARGQVIRNFPLGVTQAGSHRLTWNGKDNAGAECATGIYYVRMTAGRNSFIRKAVLMK